jgi:hypothetical protein
MMFQVVATKHQPEYFREKRVAFTYKNAMALVDYFILDSGLVFEVNAKQTEWAATDLQQVGQSQAFILVMTIEISEWDNRYEEDSNGL